MQTSSKMNGKFALLFLCGTLPSQGESAHEKIGKKVKLFLKNNLRAGSYHADFDRSLGVMKPKLEKIKNLVNTVLDQKKKAGYRYEMCIPSLNLITSLLIFKEYHSNYWSYDGDACELTEPQCLQLENHIKELKAFVERCNKAMQTRKEVKKLIAFSRMAKWAKGRQAMIVMKEYDLCDCKAHHHDCWIEFFDEQSMYDEFLAKEKNTRKLLRTREWQKNVGEWRRKNVVFVERPDSESSDHEWFFGKTRRRLKQAEE